MYDKEVKKIIKDAINNKNNKHDPIEIAKQISSEERKLYKQKQDPELKKQNTRDDKCYQAVRTEIVAEIFRFVSTNSKLPANLAVDILAELSKEPTNKAKPGRKSEMDYTVNAYLQQIVEENTGAERVLTKLESRGMIDAHIKVPNKINKLNTIKEKSAKDLERFLIKSGIISSSQKAFLMGRLFYQVEQNRMSKETAVKILLTLSKCQSKKGDYQKNYSLAKILSYSLSYIKHIPKNINKIKVKGHKETKFEAEQRKEQEYLAKIIPEIVKEVFRQCGLKDGWRNDYKIVQTHQALYKAYREYGTNHRFRAELVFNDMQAMVDSGALSLVDAAAFLRGLYHSANDLSNNRFNGATRARIISAALKLNNSNKYPALVKEFFNQIKQYESRKNLVSTPTGIVRCMYNNALKNKKNINPRDFINNILTLKEKGAASQEELLRDFAYIIKKSEINFSVSLNKYLKERCQNSDDDKHAAFLSDLKGVSSRNVEETKTAIKANFSCFNAKNLNTFYQAVNNSEGGDDLHLITEKSIIAYSKKNGLDATLKLLSDKEFLNKINSNKKTSDMIGRTFARLYAAHHEDETSLQKIMKVLTDNVGNYKKCDNFTDGIYKIGIMASVKGEESKKEFFYNALGKIATKKPLTYKFMLDEIKKAAVQNSFWSKIACKVFSDERKQVAIDRYKAVLPPKELEKRLNDLIPKMFDPKTPRDQVAIIKRNLTKKNNKHVDEILFGFNRSPYLNRYNHLRTKQDAEKAVTDMIALVNRNIISQKDAGNILNSLCQGIKEKKLIITEALFKNSPHTKGIIKGFFANVEDAAETIFHLNNGIENSESMYKADCELIHLGDLSTDEVIQIYSHLSSKGQAQAKIVSEHVLSTVIKRNYSDNVDIAKEFFKSVGDIYSTLYTMHKGFSSVNETMLAIEKVIELERLEVITTKEASNIIEKFYTQNTNKSHNDEIRLRVIAAMNRLIVDKSNADNNIFAILSPLYASNNKNIHKAVVVANDMARTFIGLNNGTIKNKEQIKDVVSDLVALVEKKAIGINLAVAVLKKIHEKTHTKDKSIAKIEDSPLISSALREKLVEYSKKSNKNTNDFKHAVVKRIISDIYIRAASVDDFDSFFENLSELHKNKMLDEEEIVAKLNAVYLLRFNTSEVVKLINGLSKKAETSPLAKSLLKRMLVSEKLALLLDKYCDQTYSGFLECLYNDQVIELAMNDQKVADFIATATALRYQHDWRLFKDEDKYGRHLTNDIKQWATVDQRIRSGKSSSSAINNDKKRVSKINVLSNKIMASIVEIEKGQYSSSANYSKKLISEIFGGRAKNLKFLDYRNVYKQYNSISNQYDADHLIKALIKAMDEGEITEKVAADILYYCTSGSLSSSSMDSSRASRIMISLIGKGEEFDPKEHLENQTSKENFLKMRNQFYKNCQEKCSNNEKTLLDGLYSNQYNSLAPGKNAEYNQTSKDSDAVIKDFFNLSHNDKQSAIEAMPIADAVSAVVYLFEKNSSNFSGIIASIMRTFGELNDEEDYFFASAILAKLLSNKKNNALVKKAFYERYKNIPAEKFFFEIASAMAFGSHYNNLYLPVGMMADLLAHVFSEYEKNKNKDEMINIDLYIAIYNGCAKHLDGDNGIVHQNMFRLARDFFARLKEDQITSLLKRVVKDQNSNYYQQETTFFKEISSLVNGGVLRAYNGVQILYKLVKADKEEAAIFYETVSKRLDADLTNGYKKENLEDFRILKGVFSELTKEQILDLVLLSAKKRVNDNQNLELPAKADNFIAGMEIIKLAGSGLIDDNKMLSIVTDFCADKNKKKCANLFYELVDRVESDKERFSKLAKGFVAKLVNVDKFNSSKTFFKDALYESNNNCDAYYKAGRIINKLVKSERLGILKLADVKDIVSSLCRDDDSVNNVCKVLIDNFKASPSEENKSLVKHVFSHLAKTNNEAFKKALFDIMAENKNNPNVINIVNEILKKECLPDDRNSILQYLINGVPFHGTVTNQKKPIETSSTYRKVICDLVIDIYKNDDGGFDANDEVIRDLSRYLIEEFLKGDRGDNFDKMVADLLSSNSYKKHVMMELYTIYANNSINHDKILELINAMALATEDDCQIITTLEHLAERMPTYQKVKLISDLFCYSIKTDSDSFPFIKNELINLSKLHDDKKDINVGEIMLGVVKSFNNNDFPCSRKGLKMLDDLAISVYNEMDSISEDKVKKLFQLMEEKILSPKNVAERFYHIVNGKGRNYNKEIKSLVPELLNLYNKVNNPKNKKENKEFDKVAFNENFYLVMKVLCDRFSYSESKGFIGKIYTELRSEPEEKVRRAIGNICVDALLSSKDDQVKRNKVLSNEELTEKAIEMNNTLSRKGVSSKKLLQALNKEMENKGLSNDALNELNQKIRNKSVSNKNLTDELVVVILSLNDVELISQALLGARKDLFDKVVKGLNTKTATAVLLKINEYLLESCIRSILYSCCENAKGDYRAICDVLEPLLSKLPKNKEIVKKLMRDLSNNPNVTKNRGLHKIISGALNYCSKYNIGGSDALEEIIVSISLKQKRGFEKIAGDYMLSVNSKSSGCKLIFDKEFRDSAKGIIVKLGAKVENDKQSKKGFYKMLLDAAKDGDDEAKLLVKEVFSELIFRVKKSGGHGLSLIDENFKNNIKKYRRLRNEKGLLKDSEKKVLDKVIYDMVTAGDVKNVEQANLAVSNMSHLRSLPGMSDAIGGNEDLDAAKILFQAFFTSGDEELLNQIDSYNLKTEQLIECSLNSSTSFPEGNDKSGYTVGGVSLNKNTVNKNKEILTTYLSDKIYAGYVEGENNGKSNPYSQNHSIHQSLNPELNESESHRILVEATDRAVNKFYQRTDISEALDDIDSDNSMYDNGFDKIKNLIYSNDDNSFAIRENQHSYFGNDDGYASFDDDNGQSYTDILIDMVVEKAEKDNDGIVDDKHVRLLCQLDQNDYSDSQKFFSAVIDGLASKNSSNKKINHQILSGVLAKSSSNNTYQQLLSNKLSPNDYAEFILFHAKRLQIVKLQNNKIGSEERNLINFFERILKDENSNFTLCKKLTDKLINIMVNKDYDKLVSQEIVKLFSNVLGNVKNKALFKYIASKLIDSLKINNLRDGLSKEVISLLSSSMKEEFAANDKSLYAYIADELGKNFDLLNKESKDNILIEIKLELEKGDMNNCSAMLDLCCRLSTKGRLIKGGVLAKELLSQLISGLTVTGDNELYDKICGNVVKNISEVFVLLKDSERDLVVKAIKEKLSAGKNSAVVMKSRSYKMMHELCKKMISKLNLTSNKNAKDIVSLFVNLIENKDNQIDSDFNKSLQPLFDKAIDSFIDILKDAGNLSYNIRPDLIKAIDKAFPLLSSSNQKKILDMVVDGLKNESGKAVNAVMLQVVCGKSFIDMMKNTLKEDSNNERTNKVIAIGELLCSEEYLKSKGDELLGLFDYIVLNNNDSNQELCNTIFDACTAILIKKDSDQAVCKKIISHMVNLLKHDDLNVNMRTKVAALLETVLMSDLDDGKTYLYGHTITELANAFGSLSKDSRIAVIDMIRKGLQQTENVGYRARLVKLCAELSSKEHLTADYADTILPLMKTALKIESADGGDCEKIIKNIALNYHLLDEKKLCRTSVEDMIESVLTIKKNNASAKFYARMESLLKQLLSAEQFFSKDDNKNSCRGDLLLLVERILSADSSEKVLRASIIQIYKTVLLDKDADHALCLAIACSLSSKLEKLDEDSSATIGSMIEEGLKKDGDVKERMEVLSGKGTKMFVYVLLSQLASNDVNDYKGTFRQLKRYYNPSESKIKSKIVREIAEKYYCTNNSELQSAAKNVLVDMASMGMQQHRNALVMEMMSAATADNVAQTKTEVESRLAVLLDQISKNEYQYKTSKGYFAQFMDYCTGNGVPDLKEQIAQHQQVLIANGANPEVATAINKSLLNLEKKGLSSNSGSSLRKATVASIGKLLSNRNISNDIKQEQLKLLNSIVGKETNKKVLKEILEALGELTLKPGNGQAAARQIAIEIAMKIMEKGKYIYWWGNDKAIVSVLRNIDKDMFADDEAADKFRENVKAYRSKSKGNLGDNFTVDKGVGKGANDSSLAYALSVLGLNTNEMLNKINNLSGKSPAIVRTVPDKGNDVNSDMQFSQKGQSFVASLDKDNGNIVEVNSNNPTQSESPEHLVANDQMN